ncbi:hypothetical protein VDG1235_3231 [Verrucomicrobiia bacterium DG1235]|nr:hypothetical protein VDG1235_3231 [Verrucomicrobiae bacterium DG1235]
MSFTYAYRYPLGTGVELEGVVELEPVEPGALTYRGGYVSVKGKRQVELSVTHSAATEAFIYLGKVSAKGALREILDTEEDQAVLPGQLVLGAERTRLVMEGVADCMRSPAFAGLFDSYGAGEVAVFPVLREGMKYGLGEAVLGASGYLCDEIVADAHHVADASVPDLGRRMELTVFKDADLSPEERAAVKVAVIGDSVASGTVIIGLVDEIAKRFPNLERVELVAPLAAVYGLARIAAFARQDIPVRIHCFETLLNALKPDYYYSPHFSEPEMHICPEAEASYREWWGRDAKGRWIADTACSGYGWSEAFFNPGKQLRMIDEELTRRHGLSLADVLSR